LADELAFHASRYFDELQAGATQSTVYATVATRATLEKFVAGITSRDTKVRRPIGESDVVDALRGSVAETAEQFGKAIGKGVRADLLEPPSDVAALARAIVEDRVETLAVLDEVARLTPGDIKRTNTVRLSFDKASELHGSAFAHLTTKTFTVAIYSHPSAPADFLTRSLKVVDELRGNPEYELFADAELHKIVTTRPRDPEQAVASTLRTIRDLMANPEWTPLGLDVVKSAVQNYADPGAYLGRVKLQLDEHVADPRYAVLGASSIKKIVARSPETTKSALDEAIAAINRISADPRYESLWKQAYIRAAVHHTDNPEGFLDAYIARCDAVRADSRLEIFSTTQVRQVALEHLDPVATLLNARESLKVLVEDDRYAQLGDAVLTRSVVQRPDNPRAMLDQVIATADAIAADPRAADVDRARIIHAVVYGATSFDDLPVRKTDRILPARTTYRLRELLANETEDQQ
jgi:hypothetical protein